MFFFNKWGRSCIHCAHSGLHAHALPAGGPGHSRMLRRAGRGARLAVRPLLPPRPVCLSRPSPASFPEGPFLRWPSPPRSRSPWGALLSISLISLTASLSLVNTFTASLPISPSLSAAFFFSFCYFLVLSLRVPQPTTRPSIAVAVNSLSWGLPALSPLPVSLDLSSTDSPCLSIHPREAPAAQGREMVIGVKMGSSPSQGAGQTRKGPVDTAPAGFVGVHSCAPHPIPPKEATSLEQLFSMALALADKPYQLISPSHRQTASALANGTLVPLAACPAGQGRCAGRQSGKTHTVSPRDTLLRSPQTQSNTGKSRTRLADRSEHTDAHSPVHRHRGPRDTTATAPPLCVSSGMCSSV